MYRDYNCHCVGKKKGTDDKKRLFFKRCFVQISEHNELIYRAGFFFKLKVYTFLSIAKGFCFWFEKAIREVVLNYENNEIAKIFTSLFQVVGFGWKKVRRIDLELLTKTWKLYHIVGIVMMIICRKMKFISSPPLISSLLLTQSRRVDRL